MQPNFKKLLFLNVAFLLGLVTSFTSQAQFITSWRVYSAGQSITIPTAASLGDVYNYSVDWGDGSTSTAQTGDATHSYATAGTYAVSISGTFPRIYFNNGGYKSSILDVSQWGNNVWSSMNSAFEGCDNLNITATDIPNLSAVTDMESMFHNCSILNPVGAAATALNNWNTSSVKDMGSMFNFAKAFNQNLNSWNTASVTNMRGMFGSARAFNGNISSWNTASVTDMGGMFSEAYMFDQNIGGWETSSVADMEYMFADAYVFNQNIGSWNTGAVKTMARMFRVAKKFNQNLNSWNTGLVTTMNNMFAGATDFNQDVNNWNTSSVKDMRNMFDLASSFNQNLGGWNITNVTQMEGMLNNSGMSISNYDNTLIGWAGQTVQSNVKLYALNLKYCAGADARVFLMTTYKWTISGDALSCATPVELISFTVQKSGKNLTRINWASGVESNIESMTIEHSSNTTQWETIYTCPPKGSNSNYEAYDAHPVPGDNYYRLLTTDKDGSRKLSEVRVINFANELSIQIFPNPTTGLITLSNTKIDDMIVLTDITGRQLLKKQASTEKEMLDIHSLGQGMYFITIMRDGKIVVNEKITKLN